MIGVSRSPEAAGAEAFANAARGVEKAFKRYHAVSVEELRHDPSDLLGFFVDEDPADDVPGMGADADFDWSADSASAQLHMQIAQVRVGGSFLRRHFADKIAGKREIKNFATSMIFANFCHF